MDNRTLWAVTFYGTMKDPHRDYQGAIIHDTFTVHVVTDKGYQSAIDAAKRDSEKTWDVTLKAVEEIGGVPVVVA